MDNVEDWVSAEFQNLAEVLSDYDPYLALEMVPVAERSTMVDKSKIFRVVDTKRNKVVLFADSLVQPKEILARIWSMDQTYNKVVDNMDRQNEAAQALLMRRHMDEIEAQRDFALFIGKNTKSRWIHNGRVRDEHFNDLGSVRKVIDK